MGLAIEKDASVAGVVRVSTDPSWPRPHVAVVVGLHGNEPCGIWAMERLRRDLEDGTLPMAAGTIICIQGNPLACAQRRRHSEGGADLNRLFDWAFEEGLPRSQWTYEHHRALALRPVVEEVDFMIDLHSGTSPTPPFVIVNEIDAAYDLAEILGPRYVSHGWFGEGFLGNKTSIGVLARRGCPGLGVECGQHEDEGAADIAYECARRFCVAAGVLQGEAPPKEDVTHLEMFSPLKKPSTGFRFAQPLVGLQRLSAGTVLGSDGELEVRLAHDCYALLPNDGVEVGGDVIYMAREREPTRRR